MTDIDDVIKENGLVEVLIAGSWSYSWDLIGIYYSPAERHWFWYEDHGCSCRGFGDFVEELGELSNGSKKDAERALRQFGAESYADEYSRDDLDRDLAELRAFRHSDAVEELKKRED